MMDSRIKFQDLKRLHESVRTELTSAFSTVLDESAFIQGPFVKKFEEEFSSFTGIEHCSGVGNGTDALEIALQALDIGQGDLVLVPSMTFAATAEAVVSRGAIPVFVDLDPSTLCSSLSDFQAALSVTPRKPKALIMVHLHGRAYEVEAVASFAKAAGIVVLEDCAQSHGAKVNGKHVGGFGAAGTFSFYPGKNLGALGDAGAVVTTSVAVKQKVNMLRDHGRTQKYYHDEVGRNSRLDGLQAAFLSVKLKHLREWTNKRQKVADAYFENLSDYSELVLPAKPAHRDEHVFHNFVVRVVAGKQSRDVIASKLKELGVETGVHYPLGLHMQPAFKQFSLGNSLKKTEQVCSEILSLPIDPLMSTSEIDEVCARVQKVFRGN